MIETTIPEIDVDELMREVQSEAAGCGDGAGRAPGTVFVGRPDERDGEPVNAGGGVLSLPRLPESPLFPRKETYSVADFLAFHDQEFVRYAYWGILGREPDERGGEHYLRRLRSGDLGKIEILGRLRLSLEGRREGARIRGLLLPFAVHTAGRLPGLGYAVRMALALVRLPSLMRSLQTFEAFTNQRVTEVRDAVNGTADVLERYAREQQALCGELREELARHRRLLAEGERRLARLVEETRARLDEAGRTPEELGLGGLLDEGAHLSDTFYLHFEDRFRGTREDIKARLAIYLPVLTAAGAGVPEAPVLDLGCGRGEWLELLRENGLAAKGVDLNRVMAEDCRKAGLDVAEADALGWLRAQPEGSLGAVTGFHIVEHLELEALMALLDEALRALRPGGVAVFETPNPENIVTGACNFYIDPTHRNPLPPMTLEFLVESRGFTRVEVRRLHPVEGQKHDDPVLDKLLYGPQDYAVIGYKA